MQNIADNKIISLIKATIDRKKLVSILKIYEFYKKLI